MFDSFFKYINDYASEPLSEAEHDLVKAAFIPKKLKRRHFFLSEGDLCKYFAFIVKGAMQQYLIDNKGVTHIVHLGIENWWMGDRESWVMFSPSNYFIEAWEDCELLLITRADTLRLAKQLPAFNEMVRRMDDRNNIATQKRIASQISLTAEKRYLDFIGSHPDFLTRFPQHIIASYLGINKDTLSRVRKQATKK
ncbi:Crp/Fnr family transcriptional regulator [Mucilaginibacter sp. X4EP1]|uniref:Crp/Fnr family transcriptional regulator n=1 Tax=Mucilaginibacter sp. X4EP1 TaxID=2723092 RepID=UPI0021672241|nr:Crp/Fnr family transcriptional regulator [Mucilaginibacter sp. X4EP1]MCS3812010.1 CRP-like cAMP-binding protein [Mucilaginibacter sp. X4EP1]